MNKKFYLEDSIGFLTNLAAIELKYTLTRTFKKHGHDVTAEQFGVLVSLWSNDGQTQSELATHLAKDKTNMTRILDGLAKAKLIIRQTHESDRRSFRIRLTAKAEDLREKLIPIAQQVNIQATSGLSLQEVADLKRFLKAMFINLR